MSYYLIHITYPILFVAVLARQLCLPVLAVLFLLSGGALVGAGKLSYAGILLVAVLGCVLADLVWFEAGRISGKRVVRLLCALATDPSYCIRRGRMIFRKKGIRLLLIAKFVPGLDGISAPMAGMLGASRGSFVLHDMGGATLWAAAYITCGFFFAKEMALVTRRVSAFANVLVLVLGVPLLLFLVWKLLHDTGGVEEPPGCRRETWRDRSASLRGGSAWCAGNSGSSTTRSTGDPAEETHCCSPGCWRRHLLPLEKQFR